MRERHGYTLVELLMVVVVIGLLATIGVPRLSEMRERAHLATTQADLKNLATYEERQRMVSGVYAPLESLAEYATSPGVDVTITWLATDGFAAVATNDRLPGLECGYFVGPSDADQTGPATEPGRVTCSMP